MVAVAIYYRGEFKLSARQTRLVYQRSCCRYCRGDGNATAKVLLLLVNRLPQGHPL